MLPELRNHLKFNFTVNLLDGAFFGFALGFASFVTIIPLFVSKMTGSALLIGLIPAIHTVGWQFPQLFTAQRVARQPRYKPMVMVMTIHERLPFLGLALVAWTIPTIGVQTALILTFILLIWQGIGGGLTATAWQSMVGKIIPADIRGTFFGAQSSAANLLASISAILAGWILQEIDSPQDFTINFLFAFLAMAISWIMLSLTREPAHQPVVENPQQNYWRNLRSLLREDKNFRWFLVVRMLSPLALMGFAFYTVYAVNELGMNELSVGILTSVLLIIQIVANPLMGWLGDKTGHRIVMAVGIVASIFSALIAWWAPTAIWFYPVFILAGIANVAIWTIGLAMLQEFGKESNRPAYIGMANTFVAPFSILAPFIGGWLADNYGYPSAFLASAVFGLITTIVLVGLVENPDRSLPGSQPTIGETKS